LLHIFGEEADQDASLADVLSLRWMVCSEQALGQVVTSPIRARRRRSLVGQHGLRRIRNRSYWLHAQRRGTAQLWTLWGRVHLLWQRNRYACFNANSTWK